MLSPAGFDVRKSAQNKYSLLETKSGAADFAKSAANHFATAKMQKHNKIVAMRAFLDVTFEHDRPWENSTIRGPRRSYAFLDK